MLIDAVKKTIVEHSMVKRGERVMAAVSGGVDSVVMLHALDALRDALGFELSVCHLNHSLRGKESERDLEFVRALAKRLGLRFCSSTLRPGWERGSRGSLQEEARSRRYAFFERAGRRLGAHKTAIGHTLDDNAETVIMRFLKGSSLRGLSGIPPVRGRFIRPLSGVTREELEAYARNAGITFVVDSTNLLADYLRNDVRLNLVPYLMERYNPGISRTVARTASVLAIDEDFLSTVSAKAFEEAYAGKRGKAVFLDRDRLAVLHDSILSRVLLAAIGRIREKPDTYSHHLLSFAAAIRGKRPNVTVHAPGLRFIREYGRVTLKAGPDDEACGVHAALLNLKGVTELPGALYDLRASVLKRPPSRMSRSRLVAYFDMDGLKGVLSVRGFCPGDRIGPFGMEGTRKLKDVFMDRKVPLSQRCRVPLLFAGDVMLWAAGVIRSRHFAVGPGTKRVLKVECAARK